MSARLRRGGVGALVVAAVWLVAAGLLPNGAPVGVVLLGVVTGSITALTAMALILVYRATRALNFAAVALGGVGGMLGLELFRRAGWNYCAAMFVAVLVSVCVGALVDRLVVRRFAASSPILLTVATIGLAQVLGGIELLTPRLFGTTNALIGAFSTPVPGHVDVGPVVFTGNHLLVALCVPVAVAFLIWFLERTDAGVAVRAAAENRDRARLLGIPVRRLSTLVWALAAGLAGLTFVLTAPFQGVSPDVLAGPAPLLAPLAAAVVARMESLRGAVIAALALGVLDRVIAWNSSAGTSDVIFLVVILVALLVQRDRLSRGQHDEIASWLRATATRSTPAALFARTAFRVACIGAVAALVCASVVLPFVFAASTVNLVSVALVWGVVAVSLVVLVGWSGQLSLGQFALVGSGAVVAGNVVEQTRVDFFVALLLAALTGAAIAFVLGLPALRIRGPFLAVTTIAFAVALDSYFLNPTHVSWLPEEIGRPALLSRMPLESERTMYAMCLAVLIVAVFIARGFRRARAGRAAIAVRDNERAAATMGIPPVAVRLWGFGLAGALAGLGGGLHVLLLHGARLGTYQPLESIQVFSGAVIGGIGSIGGALLGVATVRLASGLAGGYRLVVTGSGVLVVLMLLPGGLGQAVAALRDGLLRHVTRQPGAAGLRAPVRSGTAAQKHEALGRPLLTCCGVEARYGQRQVLFGVDFEVQGGETVALLGTNGAGKSTFLKAVCGLIAGSGTVEFDGAALHGLDPEEIARRGVILMPGGKSVFPGLTVDDHLRLAGWMARGDREGAAARRREALELFPALARLVGSRAGDLSGGEQQMLSLAQVLMMRPRLLLIDELSLGLAPRVVGELLDVVRSITARGTTVVIVEQSVSLALQLAERAVFMEKGQVRFSGPTADLLDRPDLLRSVFFERVDAPRHTKKRGGATDDVALSCEQVSKTFGGVRALDGVSLQLRRGEILGLVGANGAGKTTMLDCISGLLPVDNGRVVLDGADVTGLPTWQRARQGLGRSFQDATLYPSLSVSETIAVAVERHVTCRDPLADALHLPASYESEVLVFDRVEALVENLGLAEVRDKLVAELSTGTRRIVDVACVLAARPKVLLLDEPSAGIAQREAEALAPLLLRIRDETGCSMIIVEHDIPLLTSISDRLVALGTGAVIADGLPETVMTDPQVVAAYLGTNIGAIRRSVRP